MKTDILLKLELLLISRKRGDYINNFRERWTDKEVLEVYHYALSKEEVIDDCELEFISLAAILIDIFQDGNQMDIKEWKNMTLDEQNSLLFTYGYNRK